MSAQRRKAAKPSVAQIRPFEQVLGALSLGGIFFGGMAVAVGLTFGTVSSALGGWLSARPGSRTSNTS